MTKHVIHIIFLLLIFSEITAQNNLPLLFGYRGSVAASRMLPSTQEFTANKFEININYNVWIANKTLSFGSIQHIRKSNRLTSQDVQNIINQMEENNRIGSGQDVLVLGLGIRSKIKEHPVLWNFTVSDRMNVNAYIPKALAQLVWLGNKNFEGETIDLSQTSITGVYYRDYSIGFATPMKEWSNWKSSIGMRMGYYQGLAGITNPREQFYFSTAVGAEYIELDYNFDYRYTGIQNFNLFKTYGHGFGLSIGTTFSYKNILNFDLALTDIGSIKFNSMVYRVSDDNTFRFRGLGLEDLVNPTAFLDSLEKIFTPEIDSLGDNSFKVPIGKRLHFMLGWKLVKENKFHGPVRLSFLYLQGFSEQAGSTLYPEFSLAIHSSIFQYCVLGLNATWGGFNNFAMGGIIGMRFKDFSLSFYSDNFTGFIFPNKATGAAGGFMIQFLF